MSATKYFPDGECYSPAHTAMDLKKGLKQAKLDGPKRKSSWDNDIRHGSQEYFATVFRADDHYYYRDIKGPRRPPLNGFWKTQLKIQANS